MDELIVQGEISSRIWSLRGEEVMLDRDLAELYGVKSIRLREQVKRNSERFPNDFMFQLTDKEVESMVSQNAIPSKQHLGGALPYAFTEEGIYILLEYCVGVHPCVYPLNMHKNEILNIKFKGQTHLCKRADTRVCPYGGALI